MLSQLWHFYTSDSLLPITQLSLRTAGLAVNHELMGLLFCLVLHPGGEITLQFFHIIFQRCCFGSVTYPAVTVFHSSQACVFLYVLVYLVTAMYVHSTFLYALMWMYWMLTDVFCCLLTDNLSDYCSTVLFLWIRILKGKCECLQKKVTGYFR